MFVVAACGGTADRPTQTAGAPASAGTAKWEEFRSHLVVSAKELHSITAEWAGTDQTDAAAQDAQAQKLQRWADSESEWLKAHPFDSCYAGTYAPWWSSVIVARDYARLIHEGIAEGHQIRLNEADRTHLLAEMKKTSNSIPISHDACTT